MHIRIFVIFLNIFFFRAEKTFRIFILLPLLPAFEGDIASDTGNALRTILHFNYISICRGSDSLMKQIQSHGINPSNYVSFCSLRQHGEILSMPVTELIYIHSKLMIIGKKSFSRFRFFLIEIVKFNLIHDFLYSSKELVKLIANRFEKLIHFHDFLVPKNHKLIGFGKLC